MKEEYKDLRKIDLHMLKEGEISFSEIRNFFGRDLIEFSSKDYNKLEKPANWQLLNVYKNKTKGREYKQIIMIVYDETTQKKLALIHQFSKGLWEKKILEIEDEVVDEQNGIDYTDLGVEYLDKGMEKILIPKGMNIAQENVEKATLEEIHEARMIFIKIAMKMFPKEEKDVNLLIDIIDLTLANKLMNKKTKTSQPKLKRGRPRKNEGEIK